MHRISQYDYEHLKKMEEKARMSEQRYKRLKNSLPIPKIDDASPQATLLAVDALRRIFLEERFNLMDAIVAERGYGPVSDSDTHFRGRVLESVLNGHCTGQSKPDFAYAELKLIETKTLHEITQVMTVGVIFEAIDRQSGDYAIVDYASSNFFKKCRRMIVVSYDKVGMQRGLVVNNVFAFEGSNRLWADKLEEDWLSISGEMQRTIAQYKAGTVRRKASGICKSDSGGRNSRRPNGLLGIRNDSIVFTKKLFELASKHYYEVAGP
jgi:hypothetical protein